MFDLAWSEIAVIAVVALIAIGPKDLPIAMKAVAEMIKKARRMAGEFQTHFDEMVREADLQDVRNQFNELRGMDVKSKILDAVDSDGSLRRTVGDNPLNPALYTPPPPVETAPVAPDPNAVPPAPPPVPEVSAPQVPLPQVPLPQVSAAPDASAVPVAGSSGDAPAPVAPVPAPPDAAVDRPQPRA